ncbi:4a-hydroxytetrahydrobiopterin dehydratase [Duganella aceris]|uniref:Putative pterin-4-alpha-carbinolamine dehydratase n=1 Tax=Duganella aceris TaxID=2703883 RepID=A0ABX0FVB5_9BURK|nr:4a-hydroxytetrahydrobiopterin dehydratase [Duganella aceris]NGZ88234.1 4a-hydroxytetrahydrobiopterin dehydratase [Duganella aceris]
MIASAADLLASRCRPTKDALDAAEAERLLALLAGGGWAIDDNKLVRTFGFTNYYRTMAFVNALAFLSHAEDHHPEMTVTYKNCIVRYDTHSANGLSLNDFICAAKADALFDSAAVKA